MQLGPITLSTNTCLLSCCLLSYSHLQSSEALARAMKEWERRPGERNGFSDSPGDCLAFKYLRDVSAAAVVDYLQSSWRKKHCAPSSIGCVLVLKMVCGSKQQQQM
jgi:hypothetical protein